MVRASVHIRNAALRGLLSGLLVVLELRDHRCGTAILRRRECGASLPSGFLLLAVSGAPATGVFSGRGVRASAVALGHQVPADPRDHDDRAARELSLPRATDLD